MYGDNDNFKISFQLSVPSGGSQESSSSSSDENSSDTVIDLIECSSVEAGISLANSYISKKINLSHCKVLVISEEVAMTNRYF